ncbi:MAG TPA: alpha/beta fold hydrolase [Polyangiaceae bacterium]|nr:alpha/beta fold hydrolase [Polyangiaceae bacterium]
MASSWRSPAPLALAALVTFACSKTHEPAVATSSPQPSAAAATATPTPVQRPTEAALRAQLAAVARGEPDYDRMVPALAEEIRARRGAGRVAARLGAPRSVVFAEQRSGVDVYDVTSENGFARWRIALAPDGKVETLRFQVLEKPPAPPGDAERAAPHAEPGPPGDAERAAAIDAWLAREGDAFSGAVLVARGGVPIYQKAVGLADREHSRANTLGTRFRIASMTKMFTAVAVLQLVQAGKLRLDAPLGTYLPDYPNQDIARKVTLDHLLTHTGGTGDVFGAELAARGPTPSLREYVAAQGARAPRFEPGSRYEYSNYGFVLLGRVIEVASGQSYYDYVARHVFAPAGMAHSDFATIDDASEERAVGYTRYRAGEASEASPDAGAGAALVSNRPRLEQRGTPAGGAWSTLGDLLAFANALEGHRLLDERHTELATTGKVPTPDGGRYAYGFSDGTPLPGLRCIGHNGGSAGASARMRICRAPDDPSSQVVIVLSNLDPPAGNELMRLIRAGFSLGAEPAEPGRRVSIGAQSMYIECGGRGSPTVVFDAGLGGNTDHWEGVIADVRRETRACRYDRLGTGRSDAAPRPHTPVDMALELSELLAASGEHSPLVLVGHSLGGLNVRLFAQNDPGAVVGLVLVESMHEDQYQRVAALAPEAVQQQGRAQLEANREGLTWEGLTAGLRALRGGERSLGSRPLVVLSQGLPPRVQPGLSEPTAQRMWAERQALQAELAQLSSNSAHVVAEHSGHAVVRDQPQLVVDATLEVVRAVRQGRRVEREHMTSPH